MSLLGRLKDAARRNRLWQSMFLDALPEGEGRPPTVRYRHFFLMLQPVRVRADSLRFSATFGLGLAALALTAMLVVTGVLLMFHYVPSTDAKIGAYASLEELRYAVPCGQLVRDMHRWAAQGLVIVAFLHLLRVFLRGAFKQPRQFNWVLGVLLLVLTLAESFTGYLLSWDQTAYWAVEVGTRMMAAVPWLGEPLAKLLLGGTEIGQLALVRFYGLHVFVLPALGLVLLVSHLWRVRQDGGLAHRSENEGPSGAAAVPAPLVPAWPHLIVRELVVVLLCVAVLLGLALLWHAPLDAPADPAHPPSPVKAAWYFLWLQELVSYDYGPLTRLHWPPWNADGPTLGSAFWGGVFVPTLCVLALLAIPYIRPRRQGIGVYCPRGRRWACAAFCLAASAVVALTIVGYYFRGPDWRLIWP